MSWVEKISQNIKKIFSEARPALTQSIPPILLLCELKNRPGLSAIALTSAIIKRLPEAGINTGVNPDGSPNKINQFVRIISEEIIKEFKDNAKVTMAIAPGSVISTGTGSCPVGPVVVSTTNTIPSSSDGIIQ